MSSDFMYRLSTLEPVVWSYARHYEIKGILPADDLYQEGLIELDKTSSLEFYKNLSREQFATYFRVRLSSRYRRLIRFHTQQKRDWRSTVYFDEFLEEKSFSRVEESDPFTVDASSLPYFCGSNTDSPYTELELRGKAKEAEEFIEAVKAGLDLDSRKAFEHIISGDFPEEIKAEYQRVPGHVSITVLSKILGWDRGKTCYALKRIKKCASAVIKKQFRTGSLLWTKDNVKDVIKRQK